MTDLEKLNEYHKELLEELESRSIMSGDYCLLVIVGGHAKFAYSDVAHFMSRVLDDIKNVDPMFNIEFQLMVFED